MSNITILKLFCYLGIDICQCIHLVYAWFWMRCFLPVCKWWYC